MIGKSSMVINLSSGMDKEMFINLPTMHAKFLAICTLQVHIILKPLISIFSEMALFAKLRQNSNSDVFLIQQIGRQFTSTVRASDHICNMKLGTKFRD